MGFVSLDRVKDHLRIVNDDRNEILDLYRRMAESAVVAFLNRQVFDDTEALNEAVLQGTAGKAPMIATDDIRGAVLLIVGYMNKYPEGETSAVSASMIDIACPLLQPHRMGMGV